MQNLTLGWGGHGPFAKGDTCVITLLGSSHRPFSWTGIIFDPFYQRGRVLRDKMGRDIAQRH